MATQAQLRQMLSICGIPNGNPPGVVTQAFMDSQGLTSINDFVALRPKDAKDMIKGYNEIVTAGGVRLGVTHKRKIEALIWWVRNRIRQQQPIGVADWTDIALNRAIVEMDLEEEGKSGDDSKAVNPGKIELGLEYFDWILGFENFLSAKMGIQGKLDYVIRRDKPAGWDVEVDATNDNERRVYRTRLTGVEFDTDNETVWHLLKDAVLTTDAWTHIETYEGTNNGRGAMVSLRDFYEGVGEASKRKTLAEAEISNLHYKSEHLYSFARFATKMKRAYTVLERHGYVFTDEQKVSKLHEKCGVTNSSAFDIAKRFMMDHYRNDFDGAITYMTRKFTEIFPNAIVDGGRKGRNKRTIREANTSRGRGRFGRRGSRSQRGGRGNGNRGRHEDQPGRPAWFNGVDVSNVQRNFTQDEMDRLGPPGQRYIFEQRENLNQQRDSYGRGPGRGGRGRGRSRGQGRAAYGREPGRGGRYVQEIQVTNEKQNDGEESEVTNDARSQSTRGGQSGSRFGRGAYPPGYPPGMGKA